MIRVGLTGTMASGKTTFSEVWQQHGAYVLNADNVARHLMQQDDRIIQAVKSVFGQDSYSDDGTLNTVYLSKEAFEKGRVKELNTIVHPILRENVVMRMKKVEEEGAQVFLYEAAILLNNGRPSEFDFIIWIEAPKKELIDRSVIRSNITIMEAVRRLQAQRSLTDVLPLIDFVLFNDKNVEWFKSQASALYEKVVHQSF